MSLHRSQWKIQAKQLSELLQSNGKDEGMIREMLDSLNGLVYPVEKVYSEDIEYLFKCFVKHFAALTGDLRIRVAQLTYNLQTYQKVDIQSDVLVNLLKLFLSLLTSTNPPNELLYAAASILQPTISVEDSASLFERDGSLMKMCLGCGCPVETQRAALNFVTTLCDYSKQLHTTLFTSALDSLLVSIGSTSQTHQDQPSSPLLLHKLVLSKLCFLRSSLPHLCPPFSSLPAILCSLKANMSVGLPGHTTASMVVMSVQPPLSLSQASPQSLSKSVLARGGSSSMGGSQERRGQRKNKKGKSKNKSLDSQTSSGEDSIHRSSSSESSSTVYRKHWSHQSQHRSDSNVHRRNRGWGVTQGKRDVSSSESDVSDSEASRLKAVCCKIRLQAYSSLALIFQLLDHHTSFSYWLSFLPDGPRPPNSPDVLLSCVLKDPSPKCREAAAFVLCAMLDGSKPYLAVANDKPPSTRAFTPYSITLGGVVRELHHTLLLALTAEPHQTCCAQLLKALCLLVANTSYHQLSEGYLSRVIATLERVCTHKDVHVQTAALSCFRAVVSMSPRHREVEAWLAGPDGERMSSSSSPSTPWLFQHSISLLQMQGPLVVQTESLNVLGSLARYCFPQIRGCWGQLRDLYLNDLSSISPRAQQHVLKMLEELCRALAASPSAELVLFWEQLLGGPLTSVLQNYHSHGPLASQACDVLSTMHSQTMADLKFPIRMLALSLPLELCGDEAAPNAVRASAVRILGVYLLFDTLSEDDGFFMDCQSVITSCLSSSGVVVRVQSSWALANLMDSFSSHSHLLRPQLVGSLSESVLCGLKDGDKVRSNAVRAAGNLLKHLPENALPSCKMIVEEMSLYLAKCVNLGSMKSRWNACYACHSALCNSVFVSYLPSGMVAIVSALCRAVQSCKNFKVRSNAAMALTSAARGRVLSSQQFSEVWSALWQALENSEQQEDFSEFKHAATLKEQLCDAVCHLFMTVSTDAGAETGLLSQDLQLSSLNHFSHFLSRSLLFDSDSGLEKEERRRLIESTRDELMQLEDHAAAGLKCLCDIFRKCFVKQEKQDKVLD